MKAKYLSPLKISMVSGELCSIKTESIAEMLMSMKAGSLTVCHKVTEESSIRMVLSMSALSGLGWKMVKESKSALSRMKILSMRKLPLSRRATSTLVFTRLILTE